MEMQTAVLTLCALVLGLLFHAAHAQLPSMLQTFFSPTHVPGMLINIYQLLTDPTHLFFAAVAFTSASEDITVTEDGGTAMFCVAIVDDGTVGGTGTTAAITVNLNFPAVGSTNPTGTCRRQWPALILA